MVVQAKASHLLDRKQKLDMLDGTVTKSFGSLVWQLRLVMVKTFGSLVWKLRLVFFSHAAEWSRQWRPCKSVVVVSNSLLLPSSIFPKLNTLYSMRLGTGNFKAGRPEIDAREISRLAWLLVGKMIFPSQYWLILKWKIMPLLLHSDRAFLNSVVGRWGSTLKTASNFTWNLACEFSGIFPRVVRF